MSTAGATGLCVHGRASSSRDYFASPPMAMTVYFTGPDPTLRTWCMVPWAM